MRGRPIYHLLALLVVAIWGVTFVCTKVLIAAGMHPAAIFFCRFVLAYIGIWVYTLLSGKERKVWNGWKEEGIFLLLGFTGGSMYFLTENTALVYTQASNTAFLVGTAPLLTALLTLLYGRWGKSRFARSLEKIHVDWALVGGTLLALVGMGMMVFEGRSIHLSAKGDLLAIGAALCWAVYSLFMGPMTRDYGTLTATRKVFFYGLLTILPFLGGCRDSFSTAILGRTAVWGNLLFLGLVASMLCFLIWNLVIDKLGNVTSTNYVYLNPIFTMLSAMALLGERMTLAAGIGAALILAGVIWAGQQRPRRKTLEVVAAIIRKGDQIFATQRGYGEWKDWWELPGGKVEPGEAPQDALKREIREELDTEIAVDKFLCTIEWDYPKFHLVMHCYMCSLVTEALHLNEHEAARWLGENTLHSVNWLPADDQLLPLIAQELKKV